MAALRRRACPGSDAIPPSPPDNPDQWCPICGRDMPVSNDGCIVRHGMSYAAMLGHLASVVTSLERGWWEPIWDQPQGPLQ